MKYLVLLLIPLFAFADEIDLKCKDNSYQVTFTSPSSGEKTLWCQKLVDGKPVKHGMEFKRKSDGSLIHMHYYKNGKKLEKIPEDVINQYTAPKIIFTTPDEDLNSNFMDLNEAEGLLLTATAHSRKNQITMWDFRKNKKIWDFSIPTKISQGKAVSFRLRRPSAEVVVAHEVNRITILDYRSGKIKKEFKLKHHVNILKHGSLFDLYCFSGLQSVSRGDHLASCFNEKWERTKYIKKFTPLYSTDNLWCLSKKGLLLLNNNKINGELLEAPNLATTNRKQAHVLDSPAQIELGPVCSHYVVIHERSSSSPSRVDLYSTENYKKIYTLENRFQHAFSPNGKWLITMDGATSKSSKKAGYDFSLFHTGHRQVQNFQFELPSDSVFRRVINLFISDSGRFLVIFDGEKYNIYDLAT